MIQRIEFFCFRGFERLSANLLPHAYIVGPNSAGKSTILEAIALAEQCLRLAKRKISTMTVVDRGSRRRAYSIPDALNVEDEPVRYDFGSEEARVEIFWENGASIHIVWPEETGEDDIQAYFYLNENGTQPYGLPSIRNLFAETTIIPIITPLDRIEELKTAIYVQGNSTTRLASRHFRNNLWLMSKTDQWEIFKEFCSHWLPEIKLANIELNISVNRLVVFYTEVGSRTPKELAWAGDGIQIWVQLLWHLFKASESNTIILDEPEVYLHPDLQRRLVRLLDSFPAQIILASHSADVLSEAPVDGILWVDRRQGGARRASSQKTFADLSASLGSSYNLVLARSMRAKLVVATDVTDLRILRILGKQIGAVKFANEQIVSLVQLTEVNKWSGIQNLGTTLRTVLPHTLPAAVLLQAGYRSVELNEKISDTLTAPNITALTLEKTEIENYLLDVEAIAKNSGASNENIAIKLSEIFICLHDESRAAFTAMWVSAALNGEASSTVAKAENAFDLIWARSGSRSSIVSGKNVIRKLNIWLEKDGYRSVTGYSLAKIIKPQSIDRDIIKVIFEIEDIIGFAAK